MIPVDFTGYEGILKDIKELAQEDVRPLNYQIVWMLKEALKHRMNAPSALGPMTLQVVPKSAR